MKFLKIDSVALIESTPRGDAWKVMIIEEGLSKNGKYYPAEALKQAIPLFEKSKVCFYEWSGKHFDHIPLSVERMRPEGFPLQTAGYLDNVKYETVNIQGREVTGLTGHLRLFDTEKIRPLKDIIKNAWQKGLKNILGLSINAEGPACVRMLNGQPVSFVQAIQRVFSTDFVTQPAAGGGLLKMIESANQTGGHEIMFQKILEALKKFSPKIMEGVDIANITEEEVLGIFKNVMKEAETAKSANFATLKDIVAKMESKKFEEALPLVEKLTATADPSSSDAASKEAADKAAKDAADKAAKEATDKATKEAADKAAKEASQTSSDALNRARAAEARVAELEKKQQVRECKELLESRLGASKLPEPVKDKVRGQFSGKIFQESEIDTIIKMETKTLAKLVESGSIIDLGSDDPDAVGAFVAREPVTRLQASMDLMFGYKPNDSEKDQYKDVFGFQSLREAYVVYTDDPMITGKLGPKAMARLQEATESSFSYALGYSMQRRMLPEYNAIAPLWRKIAVSVPVKDFKLQERIRWGGFGVLPTVQAARTSAGTPVDSATPTYPELGFPADSEATYAVMTKGGIVSVTRRMIIDDDLKILSGLPKKIAKATGYTLNQFVFDLMLGYNASGINQATIYDSIAMYATAHKNYRTGALGYDNLNTLLDDLYYQCELGYSTAAAGSDDFDTSAAATTLNVTTGTGQYFKAGDLIWCEGEIIRVESVSTDALTIARGLFGTTAATHADATTIYKVSQILALQNPTLWVPRSLRSTAVALKTSAKNPENAEGGDNTVKDAFDLEVCPYLRGDENNYYLSAKTSDVEGIEIGFLNGREEPEILVQDQPTAGNVFVYDVIRYKVRHEYGGAVVDYRAFAGGIV